MRFGITQTVDYQTNDTLSAEFFTGLPDVIQRQTEWNYTCDKTDDGYYLKPTFRNMPYRNSFVPEIYIETSQNDGQTILHMRGRPVKIIRYFSAFFSLYCLLFQIACFAILFTCGMDNLIPLFIPAAMLLFNYLLCKFGTKFSFGKIIEAIQNEFPQLQKI